LRFEVAETLKRYYFIQVTNLIHEVASNGQIEINFRHSTLTKASDNVQMYKDVVRNVAKHHNKVANFMPKPIFVKKIFLTTMMMIVAIMVQVCIPAIVYGTIRIVLRTITTTIFSMMKMMLMPSSARLQDTLLAL
jgi:hypothetical protein